MTQAACNLCGSSLEDAPAQWNKDGFEIVRCARCGLVARRTLPAPEEITGIYGDDYFGAGSTSSDPQDYLDYLGDEDSHRLRARRRLKLLTRAQVRPPGRVLDVGAAAGFFLDEATKTGWEGSGVDVAQSMTAHARDALGLAVSCSSFQQAEVEPGLDLVTMWDYIEHSIDPAGDVRAAGRLLRPGGALALSTGDVGSLVARLSGSRWHLLTPRHHNFYFDESTMGRLLSEAGFSVRYARHPGSEYSVRYCLHKLGLMLPGQKAMDAVGRSRLGDFALRVNLWDVMTVIAVRTQTRAAG